MQHEDPRVHLTREWLRRVEGDLGAADRLRDDASLCEAVVFHAQQAVEKALKAYLAWHNVPFQPTHNLTHIAEQCAAIDGDFRSLVPKVDPLTPYRTAGQYPFSPVVISPDVARDALGRPQDVNDFVLARLPRQLEGGEQEVVRRANARRPRPPSVPEGAAILERHPKLAEIVRRLVAAYEPERVYLFGPRARGDARPDSDYDILVVVSESVPPE